MYVCLFEKHKSSKCHQESLLKLETLLRTCVYTVRPKIRPKNGLFCYVPFLGSVSASVRLLRFWHNKLTAYALTVCLCVFHDAQNSSENETLLSLCAEIWGLFNNTSINSFPVENRPAHKYLCWVFTMTYLIYLKNEDCACQKSFTAIRTDGVSFQIILAKPALTAILGHYTA